MAIVFGLKIHIFVPKFGLKIHIFVPKFGQNSNFYS